MNGAHKIRLNPTPEQEQYLLKACGVARFTFNWGLAAWVRRYEAGGKPSMYALKRQFNAIKREQFPWVYEVLNGAADTGFLKGRRSERIPEVQITQERRGVIQDRWLSREGRGT